MECKAEDNKHANHKGKPIQNLIEIKFKEWDSLYEKFKELKSII